MNITYKTTESELQSALIEDLSEYLIDNETWPLLLFYSGGSAFKLYTRLFEVLAEKFFDFTQLTLAPVDERFGAANNYLEFTRLPVFEDYKKMGVNFIDTSIDSGGLDATAHWYDTVVKEKIAQVHAESGRVVGLLGMGPDGHTAGIFPYPEDRDYLLKNLFNTEHYVYGYDVGHKNEFKERFTLTRKALKLFDRNFVYVQGENKKDMLKKVIEGGDVCEIPARIWQELNEVTLYTDCLLE